MSHSENLKKNIRVTLNQEEILQGAIAGSIRMNNMIARGGLRQHGRNGDARWQHSIEGALAEMAVAKYADRFWSSGDVGLGDVGNLEVRVVAYDQGKLIFRQSDIEQGKGDSTFILLKGEYGNYRICGWIKGLSCCKDEWLRNPTEKRDEPCWMVPESALHGFKSQ